MSDANPPTEPASGATAGAAPAGKPGKRRAEVRRAKKPVLTAILATALVLGLVTSLSTVLVYRQWNGNLTVLDVNDELGDRPAEETFSGPQKPINVLVMGDDTRQGEGNAIDGESGGGGSDTTILFHLSADRTRAYGVSIPRDSLVTRPDCGEDDQIAGGEDEMWNAAYSLGGPACTVRQFEQLTGIRINHFVVVDFNGFRDMVDAIGGVPVCIPEDVDDPAHNIFIPKGNRTLKGEEALNYVRVRYTLGDGSDIGRIARQQAFIAAMAKKLISSGTLARVDRMVGFLNAATSSLTVDRGLENVTRIGELGLQFQNIGLGNIEFLTVPFEYDTREEYRGRVVWLQEAAQLWRLLRKDEPLPKRFTSGAITAANAPGKEPTEEETADAGETPTSESTASDEPTPSQTPTEEPEESPTSEATEEPSQTTTLDPTDGPTQPTEAEREERAAQGLCA